MQDNFIGQIIWIVGFIIAAIVIAIVRAIVHFVSKTSQNNSIAKIKNDPSKAAEFISYLDIMLERKPDIDELKFNLIKTKIQSSAAIGNYRILHTQEINSHQFLFFTELSFEDIDVIYKNTTIDINKKAHHNFLFQHNQQNRELEIYSNLPVDATDKFQKREFLPALYQST